MYKPIRYKKFTNKIDYSSAHKAYKQLRSFMFLFGEKFKKKHGDWIRLHIYNDLWLIMDSWNGAIKAVHEEPIYDNMFTGFKGYKLFEYLGGEFGGFSTDVSAQRYDFYYLHVFCLRNNVGRSGIKSVSKTI